jgi:predicted MFS family arabinose efflux permease
MATLIWVVLWWQRRAIEDRPLVSDLAAASAQPQHNAPTPHDEHPMAFLKLPAVWLCFSFFFWSTAALCAVQSFAAPALAQLYGLPVSATAFVVTGFMLLGALGMVIGGFLVNRVQRLERTIAMALLASACVFAICGMSLVPSAWAAALLATAGFGVGLAGPSRDMLIKKAAPPGATGRVYGTVYSGLDLGFALAAPVFGWLMDHHLSHAVFWGAAMVLVLGVLSAAAVGKGLASSH